MERKCVKSIGLDKKEYEEKSNIVVEDIKRMREILLKTEESDDKWQLLFDLLMAIDSMIGNREAFRMCVSLAISASDKYITTTYYENPVLPRRVYDDVELLPTYLIISKDMRAFYFVREKDVLPNPEHRGRRIDYEVCAYEIKDNNVSMKKLTDSEFSFQVDKDCLSETEEFVSKLQKRLEAE